MPRNIFQVTVNLPASFRNNINNNEVFNPYVFVRNRLYHFVFHRFALLYARLLSDAHRKLIEFLILLASLFCFITLIYVHVVFVQTPMTCLDGYKDVWQRNGILRVEVLSGKKKENYTLQDSYWKEKTLRLQHFDGQSYYFYTEQAVKEEGAEKSNEEVDAGRNVSIMKGDVLDDAVFDKASYFESDEFREGDEEVKGSELGKVIEDENFQPILDESILAADPDGAYIMEFSLEYGFLRLRPSKRRDLNISVTFVVLDPEVDQCFGGSFNRFLLDNFLGYDNVLLASIKKMAEKKDQKGFVRNAVMDIEYIFINNWTNEKSYITAGFVMIIFTLTISTLLRHSHHQIFIVVGFWMNYVIATFGRPRMNMWPRNLIPSSGAPVLTVILALVGMEAVMSDFFHDRSIALYVIVIVWFADLYDAVCCQSALAKRHWFRFFYLYHFLFYAYNYKFGGVYWPLTLTTSWLFTLHSMVFFFHHYELPRFLHLGTRTATHHVAAHILRNRGSPPDERPPENEDAPEPDQPERDPPDDASADQSSGMEESTPETEEDQGRRDNDQPNSTDQPGSADQSSISDQPSSADESSSTEQIGNASQFSIHQASFEDPPSFISLPRFTDQPKFTDLFRSTGKPFPTDQFRSTDKSKFPDQFGPTDQLGSTDQFRSADQFGFTDRLGSRNKFRFTEQLWSSTDQSRSFIDQSNFDCKGMEHINSTDHPYFVDQSEYMDQPSSTDGNLVPSGNASSCNCGSLHGNCKMCSQCLQKLTSFDDNFLQINRDTFPKEAVPYLSQNVQPVIASTELERYVFYNFAYKILERCQGSASQDDVQVTSSLQKSFKHCFVDKLILDVLFLKSPSLCSSLVCEKITVPCLSSEQRFYVNVVEC